LIVSIPDYEGEKFESQQWGNQWGVVGLTCTSKRIITVRNENQK